MRSRKVVIACAAAVALLLLWVALSFVIAEKGNAPSYVMTAGGDSIRQEWGYCTRFDIKREATATSVILRGVNISLFNCCRPIFKIENSLSGKTIAKGDAGYEAYLSRVRQLKSRDWDQVSSQNPDGRGMLAIKNNSVVEKLE